MKTTIFLLLLSLNCYSQKKWYAVSKNEWAIYACQFVAGAADGMHEVLVNHPHTFERIWANANMNWWLPELSQNNKKHFITIFSDGYHVTRTVEHTMNYLSIGISVLDLKDYPKKKRLLVVCKKIVLSALINRIAFKAVYNVAFNDWKERPQ